MRYQELYHERQERWDYDGRTDIVEVKLRKWIGHETDYVLEVIVMIDRKEHLHSRVAFGSEKTDSELIRIAIEDFDYKLDAHPSKDKLKPSGY